MIGIGIWRLALTWLDEFTARIANSACGAGRGPGLWISAALVSIGVVISLGGSAEAVATDGAIRGVNMRLLPYFGFASSTPTEEIIRLNDVRLELVQKAGFNLVRVGVPMNPWIEEVSAAGQDKTLKLLRGILPSASARNLSIDVVLFVPARKVVCEGQYRDAYRGGLNAVIAELPDRSDVGIEVVSEPPSCRRPDSSVDQWEGMQQELYRTVRSMRQHARFVVTGGEWGTVDGLLHLDPMPYRDDPNAMFTFHYYEPFLYTHQEVAWLRPDHVNKFVSDLAWPAETTNASRVREQALASLASDKSVDDDAQQKDRNTLLRLFEEYGTQGTTAYLSSRFRAVADWTGAHNLSTGRILLGEFGVHRHMPAPNVVKEPWPTAPVWLAAVRREAESRHMGWVVWDLDSGFGVICGKQPGTGELCPAYQSVFAR
jgi:hypothetical protein